jgi:hypothetical protein
LQQSGPKRLDKKNIKLIITPRPNVSARRIRIRHMAPGPSPVIKDLDELALRIIEARFQRKQGQIDVKQDDCFASGNAIFKQ